MSVRLNVYIRTLYLIASNPGPSMLIFNRQLHESDLKVPCVCRLSKSIRHPHYLL